MKDGIIMGTKPYKEQWQNDRFNDGIEFQDFVFDVLYAMGIPLISYSSKKYQSFIGENKAGFEIKYDRRFQETGNLAIELYEKSNKNNNKWVNSGILRHDNTIFYLIGNYEIIYIFAKKHLIMVMDKYKKYEIPTSIGFLLPKPEANKFSCHIIETKLVLNQSYFNFIKVNNDK